MRSVLILILTGVANALPRQVRSGVSDTSSSILPVAGKHWDTMSLYLLLIVSGLRFPHSYMTMIRTLAVVLSRVIPYGGLALKLPGGPVWGLPQH